jgi:hypothetical protein
MGFTAYQKGFIKRAEELGYDGEWLMKAAGLISSDGSTFTLSRGKAPAHVVKEWNAAHPDNPITLQQLIAANGGLKATRYQAGKAYKMPANKPVEVKPPAIPNPEPPRIHPGDPGVTEFTFPTPDNPNAPFLVNGKPPSQAPVVQAPKPPAPKPAPKPVASPVAKPAARPRPTTGPIGYRQNNPGNLRSDGRTKWNGAVGNAPAGQFLTFDTPEHGIRAMARTLYNYGAKHGLNTPEAVVGRYAPPSENSTKAYLSAIEKQTGFKPGQKIDLTSEDTLQRLVPAMGTHEIGGRYFNSYDPSVVSNAVASAFPRKVPR